MYVMRFIMFYFYTFCLFHICECSLVRITPNFQFISPRPPTEERTIYNEAVYDDIYGRRRLILLHGAYSFETRYEPYNLKIFFSFTLVRYNVICEIN